MIGYTPDRFRYEVVFPNSPLRPYRPAWEAMTWDEVVSRARDHILTAHDPVLEIRIIAIDPHIADQQEM